SFSRDWSSDVCSSDLRWNFAAPGAVKFHEAGLCGDALEARRAQGGQLPRRRVVPRRVWDFAATLDRRARCAARPHRRLPLAPPGRSRGCCPPRGLGPPRCLPAPLALAPALALPPGARADAVVTAYIPCHARPHSRPPVRRRL